MYNTHLAGSQVPTPDYTTLFGGTWLDTGLTATNSNTPGRLVPVNPNTDAVVPWVRSVTNNILLVGGSANLGTPWLQVSNYLANWNTFGPTIEAGTSGSIYFGESVTGYITPNTLPAGGHVVGGAFAA